MTPVDQTTFGPEGNCFSACVASVLDIPLADVPRFTGEGWWDRFTTWCAGRALWPVYKKGGDAPLGYSLVGGPCMRDGELSPRLHECVALDGVVVHDPNPCRAGLVEVQDYIVLVPCHMPQDVP